MVKEAAAVLAIALLSTTNVSADDRSAHLDDDFMQQSAAQISLAMQAQHCELRSSVWRDKLIGAVTQRLVAHLKKVRPTWNDADNNSIAGQLAYGAVYGVIGDIGMPNTEAKDFMQMGEQSIAKSMACQVVQYRKSDLLYLDSIIDAGGS